MDLKFNLAVNWQNPIKKISANTVSNRIKLWDLTIFDTLWSVNRLGQNWSTYLERDKNFYFTNRTFEFAILHFQRYNTTWQNLHDLFQKTLTTLATTHHKSWQWRFLKAETIRKSCFRSDSLNEYTTWGISLR